jgi:CrcB protein
MPLQLLVISIGAAFGACARWGLGLGLNAVFPTLPLGTLAANLVGGFLIGVAVGVFNHHPSLPPEWRLFAITGFLGGLTTFSTFSAEVVNLILKQQYAWALATAGVHVTGSLLLTLLGIYMVVWLKV